MGVELSIDRLSAILPVVGGTKKYKLVNHCALMLAYKIIINPGSNYSVPERQMYGLIQIGYTVEIEITRKVGLAVAVSFAIDKVSKKRYPQRQMDKALSFVRLSVGQEERDPKRPFATGKPVGEIKGETVMKLIAVE
ncbi:hypothetical protein COOONC_02629 [Cooperia oncophora]